MVSDECLPGLKVEVEQANSDAVRRMMESEPVLFDVAAAVERLPGMGRRMLLHAGPPLEWERASGPMKGALIGAILYEGWARKPAEAESMVSAGEVVLDCTHHHGAVAPMAGVISPSMPVFEVLDKANGISAYSNLNEGIGRVLRYGAYGPDVLRRLRWMERTLAPVIKASLRALRRDEGRGLSVRSLVAQGLTMGDECHNRCTATTALLVERLAPYISGESDRAESAGVLRFLGENSFTALNISMASAKAMALAGQGIEHSTIVTAMSRNGTDVGIWTSDAKGAWFTAPAPVPRGVWFPGYGEKDANPDLGDSAITETAGYGGFAMAAAPAIVSWVGGDVKLALEVTAQMYRITQAEHSHFRIPYLDSRGTPTGIDIRKVLDTGVAPTLNTGIAHRMAGVGQIGAGMVSMPMELFKQALKAFAQAHGIG
jgi:hypothetical protein